MTDESAQATESDSDKDGPTDPPADNAVQPIDQADRNYVLATVREVFATGDPRDRDQAIRDVADALGYRRLGSRIRNTLSRDIQTAVRRGILDNSGGQYTLLARNIDGYTRDHLIEMLIAAIGGTWQTRDEAITSAARHLGYRRTGKRIRDAFKSAINGAIRRGLLEREGPDNIRKAR